MKIRFLFFISPFFFLSLQSQTTANRIDSLMHSWYKADEPGAVISITKQNRIIFKKCYGLADLTTHQAITPDGNFNIGSLTKQFTAYALLQLFYQGKFLMTDSIGHFFRLPAPLAGVQIGALLSHSSGIPDHYAFTDTIKVRHATDRDVLVALQQADHLYFTPGTHYRYSNTAYCLLGLLIEKLSGLSYAAYLQQNIFSPLRMDDATIFQYGHSIKRRVRGYEKTAGGKFVPADADQSVFYSTEADGGLYISMNNYIKWCRAIEFGKFSRTSMIHYAWMPHTGVDTTSGLYYGCGWFIQQPAGVKKPSVIYHTGFNGGFRTVVLMIPSLDYCISIFSNRGDADLEERVAEINKILGIPDNSFIKSGPLESFNNSWPKFAPCKETSSFSTSFTRNLNAKGMVLN